LSNPARIGPNSPKRGYIISTIVVDRPADTLLDFRLAWDASHRGRAYPSAAFPVKGASF
jgi:hypothetical protein